jgi:activating signal cointegrator 1
MILKALSLTQPWATLVALGAKRIETRSWSTPHRGLIAIHASRGFPSWARDTCDEDPFYDVLTRAGILWPLGDETLTHKAAERYAGLPLGAIVAVARLVEVCPTGDILTRAAGHDAQFFTCSIRRPLTAQEAAFGDYASGRFAWLLSGITPLPVPIPCKGALGLWTVPDGIAQQVVAVIDATLRNRPSTEGAKGEANRTTHG